MDQAVNLTAQAFEGSNPSLTTIRNSHYSNDSVLKELCEIEVLDLSKRSACRQVIV